MSHSNNKILPAAPIAGYQQAKVAIDDAIARVISSGIFINGEEGAAFESEFAGYLGGGAVAGVANGTDALELALRALGVGKNDRVLTVANTVTATIAAIVACGATVEFVEIDQATMLMDPEALAERLQRGDMPRVKAIVPVHLYGHGCNMPAIIGLAKEHRCLVLEDCAQAHGASIDGRKLGTWGDMAAFSFYPTKNLGALGDAGAVAGAPHMIERVRRLRQYGWETRYISEMHGRNSRLDELQAAILRARLQRLEEENTHRDRIARLYLNNLQDLPLQLPVVATGYKHSWHQFVIRTPVRNKIQEFMESRGIICGVLYPVPIHQQPAYAAEVQLPKSERACAEVLSLPLHLGIDEAAANRVVCELRLACRQVCGLGAIS